jgi:hypothetical protein
VPEIETISISTGKQRDLKKKKQILRLAAALTAVLCGLCFRVNAVFAQEGREEAAQGELKIEGKYIKQLTLERRGGNKVKFDQPGEIIKLAVGKYFLREVQLEGGYACQIWSDDNWVEVGEDKPAVLKVGAPLKQIVKATRQGRVLALDYKLLGTGGENYVSSDSSKPPTFTVYKGDERIASGTFEYG